MYSFQIVNIVMLLLLLHFIYSNSTMSTRKAQMFGLAVVLTMMMIAAEGLSDLFATLGREYAVAASVSNALGFAFSPPIGLALAAMFRTDDRQRMILLTIPLLPNALLALSSPLTGLIFSVSDQNVYTRGPVFWVFVITYIYTIAIFIWVNIREVRRLRIREHHMLMMLCAIIDWNKCAGSLSASSYDMGMCSASRDHVLHIFARDRFPLRPSDGNA